MVNKMRYFLSWLMNQLQRNDKIGDFAQIVKQDKDSRKPRWYSTKEDWKNHLLDIGESDNALSMLDLAWDEFIRLSHSRLIMVCAADIEIKPPVLCKFCGAVSKKLVPAHGSQFHEKKGMQVECINCGARGPIYGDASSAFRAWKDGEPDFMRCDR